MYEAGYSWLTHSVIPVHFDDYDFRIMIGGSACKQPYDASLYNISAMSFGAWRTGSLSVISSSFAPASGKLLSILGKDSVHAQRP